MKIRVITKDKSVMSLDVTTIFITGDGGQSLAFFSQIGENIAFTTTKDSDFKDAMAAVGVPVPDIEVTSL